MLRAAIDLGTNTCLYLLAEIDPAQSQLDRILEDHSRIVRLGEGVHQNRRLADAAMDRTYQVLKEYASQMKAHHFDPAEAICVATSQARDASNGKEFFARVERELGLRFQVISGEVEAQLSFRGALLPHMDPSHCAIIDIGGGSTEFRDRKAGMSLDMGAVRFTESFLHSNPVTDEEFWACQDAIDALLESPSIQSWKESWDSSVQWIGVAGTATTLAANHLGLEEFNSERIDGCILTRGDIHRSVEELKWRTIEERAQMTGIEKGRADVLLAGSMILWRAMELLDIPEITVSTRGLRYGALFYSAASEG